MKITLSFDITLMKALFDIFWAKVRLCMLVSGEGKVDVEFGCMRK